MRKNIKKLLYVILAIIFLFLISSFIRDIHKNKINQDLTSAVISVADLNKKSEPVSVEEQKTIYDDYLRRIADNMSLDYKQTNYYAYFDIGNDGCLDLIYGFTSDNSDGIKIRNFLGIVNEQVSTRYFLQDPDVDTYVPVIYSNGIIRNGGQYGGSDGSVCEQFNYYKFSDNQLCHYMILSHLSAPASCEEEWYVCHIDNNYGKTLEKLTKEEYDKIKEETEAMPINNEIEWHSFAEFD